MNFCYYGAHLKVLYFQFGILELLALSFLLNQNNSMTLCRCGRNHFLHPEHYSRSFSCFSPEYRNIIAVGFLCYTRDWARLQSSSASGPVCTFDTADGLCSIVPQSEIKAALLSILQTHSMLSLFSLIAICACLDYLVLFDYPHRA